MLEKEKARLERTIADLKSKLAKLEATVTANQGQAKAQSVDPGLEEPPSTELTLGSTEPQPTKLATRRNSGSRRGIAKSEI